MKRTGIFDLADGVFKGKGVDALKASLTGRSSLLSVFGGRELFPSSIMRHTKKARQPDEDQSLETRNYRDTANVRSSRKDKSLPNTVRKHFGMSGQGCSSGALSTFPQKIGRSMVLFYSSPGDLVFDPFAGHNSRMDLCVKAGRHYVGCDLSTEFMKFNRSRADKLRTLYTNARIELHHVDSRKVPVADAVGDFTITSPPYWDIEYYGDEPEQLGKC